MSVAPPAAAGSGRLRFDLNHFTLMGLPHWSQAPVGTPAQVYAAVRAAGYTGFQNDEAVAEAFAAGLRMTGHARILSPADAHDVALRHRDAGFDATSLHLGHGLEDADAADALVESVLEAVVRHGYPLYVETHRATLTQDMWRTLTLIERFPEMRINADLSHWYNGLEMPYGDFAAKLEALQPVFARVRFVHGRVANPGSIQVPVAGGSPPPAFMTHFREMWTRCAKGFLAHAAPEDTLIFAPELLPATVDTAEGPVAVDYARVDRDGEEECDRWEQARLLCAMMDECFAAAQQPVYSGGNPIVAAPS